MNGKGVLYSDVPQVLHTGKHHRGKFDNFGSHLVDLQRASIYTV